MPLQSLGRRDPLQTQSSPFKTRDDPDSAIQIVEESDSEEQLLKRQRSSTNAISFTSSSITTSTPSSTVDNSEVNHAQSINSPSSPTLSRSYQHSATTSTSNDLKKDGYQSNGNPSKILPRANSALLALQPSTPIPTSNSNIPTSKPGKRGKGHVYTIPQELYLAELLSDPETWDILDGPGERGGPVDRVCHQKSKKTIYENLAVKFNLKFSNKDFLFCHTGLQIKNKLEVMKRQYRAASEFLNTASNKRKSPENLQIRVKELCSFFYVVRDTWSGGASLGPKEPKPRAARVPVEEVADEENERDKEGQEDEIVDDGEGEEDEAEEEEKDEIEEDDLDGKEQQVVEREKEKGRAEQGSPSIGSKLSKTTKRHRDGDVQLLLEIMCKSTKEQLELKRQKLEIFQRKIELESRLIEVQIKKVEWDLENERAKTIAENERKRMIVEMEHMRTQTLLKQAEAVILMEENRKRNASPGDQEDHTIRNNANAKIVSSYYSRNIAK